MKIVVDSGVDLCISPEQMAELGIHQVPLSVTFQGKTYREGLDITREQFYSMLSVAAIFHHLTTSPPYAERLKHCRHRPYILSVHMSSVSAALSCVQLAAKLVPQARITHFDTRLFLRLRRQAVAAPAPSKLGQSKEQAWSL
jgi:fatty acid-binding protein DegV